MGASFSAPVDISSQINGGIANGQWQNARLYKESNPYFQHGNRLDCARGEGRLWGFGLHSNGGDGEPEADSGGVNSTMDQTQSLCPRHRANTGG